MDIHKTPLFFSDAMLTSCPWPGEFPEATLREVMPAVRLGDNTFEPHRRGPLCIVKGDEHTHLPDDPTILGELQRDYDISPWYIGFSHAPVRVISSNFGYTIWHRSIGRLHKNEVHSALRTYSSPDDQKRIFGFQTYESINRFTEWLTINGESIRYPDFLRKVQTEHHYHSIGWMFLIRFFFERHPV